MTELTTEPTIHHETDVIVEKRSEGDIVHLKTNANGTISCNGRHSVLTPKGTCRIRDMAPGDLVTTRTVVIEPDPETEPEDDEEAPENQPSITP